MTKEKLEVCMMKRTMQITIVFGSILLLLGMLAGCGKNERKYVGKWVSEEGEIIELKADDTYKYVGRSPGFGLSARVQTGTWEVVKEEGEEWISFTPPIDYIASLKKSKKGNILVESLSGKSYIKRN